MDKAVFDAAKNGNVEKLKSLLSGKTPAATDYQEVGYTPLHKAAANGHSQCVALLLQVGATTDAKASGGYTPLHDAARNGHTECMRLLLTAGSDINAKNSFGGTPLHGAAFYGKKECVELLLASGAKPTMKTNDGKTAWDLASTEEMKALLSTERVRWDAAVGSEQGGANAGTTEMLMRQVEELQEALGGKDAQIDTLHGLLHKSVRRAEELEAQLKEATDANKRERGLVQLLEGAGWRLLRVQKDTP